MERNWKGRATARFDYNQYANRAYQLYIRKKERLLYPYGLLLLSLGLAGVAGYYTVIYDILPDIAIMPIFLLKYPLLFSKYTISASVLLLLLDNTNFFGGGLICIYFCYVIFLIIKKEFFYER